MIDWILHRGISTAFVIGGYAFLVWALLEIRPSRRKPDK